MKYINGLTYNLFIFIYIFLFLIEELNFFKICQKMKMRKKYDVSVKDDFNNIADGN
jgi:hypothetical protein